MNTIHTGILVVFFLLLLPAGPSIGASNSSATKPPPTLTMLNQTANTTTTKLGDQILKFYTWKPGQPGTALLLNKTTGQPLKNSFIPPPFTPTQKAEQKAVKAHVNLCNLSWLPPLDIICIPNGFNLTSMSNPQVYAALRNQANPNK